MQTILRGVALICAALAPFIYAAPAPANEVAETARLFGKRETLTGVRMSPNGDYLLYRTPAGPRESEMRTTEIASGKSAIVLSTEGTNYRIQSCNWAKNDRVLCTIIGESIFDNIKYAFTRVLSMGRTGENLKLLGARTNDRSLGINQFSGHVIDLLPDNPTSVLMDVPVIPESSLNTLVMRDKSGLSVQEVDVYTGRGKLVERPMPTASFHMTDTTGAVRLRAAVDNDGSGRIGQRARYWVRLVGSKEWTPLAVKDLDAFDSFSPQGFDETGRWLYALRPHNGRQALFRQAVDGTGKDELVFAHDEVDVDGLVTFGRTDRPVGVAYSTDYNHVEYFDPALKSLTASLGKALAGKTVSLMEETWDGSKLLLFASSDTDAGAYYLFDRASRQLKMISAVRPELQGRQLAETKPVIFPAADGAQIPGYLTLPAGRSKNLPVVVLPHGGPQSRDFWGFDWLTQFFAANGYAVIQPNFRGSSGYGADWIGENGFQGWRQAIGDINDAARWAGRTGLADPKRVAIVGWSYGGYAALQASVVAPELYAATVAIAPVTDLQRLKEDAEDYGDSKRVKAFIGTGEHVRDASPARNAASIAAPVLLFHGTMDLNVPVTQSRMMHHALKSAGKPVEYVEYDKLEHSLIDSDARIDMLTRIGGFLGANLR